MDRTLLTIDWDFFVPENPQWDWGHPVQDAVVTHMLWQARCSAFACQSQNLQQLLTTNGLEKEFWSAILPRVSMTAASTVLTVSEDHSVAFELAITANARHVLSFDAHCDLGYNSALAPEIKIDNWLAHWLLADPRNTATIVLSDTSVELKHLDILHESTKARLGVAVLKRIKFRSWTEWLATTKTTWALSAIHVCRSPEWTPPWTDKALNNFLAMLGANGLAERPAILAWEHPIPTPPSQPEPNVQHRHGVEQDADAKWRVKKPDGSYWKTRYKTKDTAEAALVQLLKNNVKGRNEHKEKMRGLIRAAR